MAKDLGIDLGTANVVINQQGKGIVLNEPSVVAIDAHSGHVLAVGQKAYDMIGLAPDDVQTIRPLQHGVITNFDAAETMLATFIDQLHVKGFFSKPTILICCPTNITTVEKSAIEEAAEQAGAKKVYLDLEPKVAAVGAGLDIFQPSGNMVIDIGGGTTDIAVLSMGNVVTSDSLRLAGIDMDEMIQADILKRHKLQIGIRAAEQIKIQIGAVYGADPDQKMAVRGQDVETGMPRTITVAAPEIQRSLRKVVQKILNAAQAVLEQTQPELATDIIDKGIMLTGGSALITGMDKALSAALQVPVVLAERPLESVALGTGILLHDLEHQKQH
ncbi:rod shape-determining protein MreB [Lactobacillus selangorensis]|uniref:Cell shape-determining protein MreB n=1 Tax=Lactobacillus selangorensis TaxID=81857 RepID=A0A0R2FWL9_9LACO|nr:rod shape-determining protein [Lactobacillus selangorensis]KRN29316.1 rod shape-determining protein MreB [Lactobacillus selangorensis]KRN34155.1 rod shape-determining protein MreB [Lactobacillus selangorensis]